MKRLLLCFFAFCLLLSGCEEPAAPSGQPEPPPARPSLQERLRAETSGELRAFYQDDFDGDGVEEAFAYTTGRGMELWFVSEQGARNLFRNLGDLTTSVFSPYGSDSPWKKPPLFFLAEWASSATRTTSLLFGVMDGKPYPVDGISGLMGFSRDGGHPGMFTALQSAYDGSPEGMGHTYKKYWFYWDDNVQAFREYGGLEISQKAFLMLAGAEGALQIIRENHGVISSILLRGNGIVNINYQTVSGSTQVWNRHMTLILPQNGALAIWDDRESTDGFYSGALSPELAVYPDSFFAALYEPYLPPAAFSAFVSDLDGNGCPELFVNMAANPYVMTLADGTVQTCPRWEYALRFLSLVKGSPALFAKNRGDTVGAGGLVDYAVYRIDSRGFQPVHVWKTQRGGGAGLQYIVDGQVSEKAAFDALCAAYDHPDGLESIPWVSENADAYLRDALRPFDPGRPCEK